MKEIALLRPELPCAEALDPFLRRIDEAHWYSNFGPLVREFEDRLATYLGEGGQRRPHVATVSNCTVGLELSLQALGLRQRARVLIPSLTFVATAQAVVRAGHRPVLADVAARSWLLTPDAARAAVQQTRIDAVLPVATFGRAQDAAAWDRFANETGVPFVIDAAGAFGNQPIGDGGLIVFSLHATKPFAAGEGGIVVTRNDALYERVRRMSNFGIDPQTGRADCLGTNAKMSEYHAAVGLAALERWRKTRAQRRRIGRLYADALARYCPSVDRQERPAAEITSILAVALPMGVNPRPTADHLRRAGICTRRWYYPPIADHPAFRGCRTAGDLSQSRSLADRLLGLPFHTGLTMAQIEYIAEGLDRAVEQVLAGGEPRMLRA